MILTLAWKEMREHQGVWLTMVIMTIVMGAGLSWLVALEDPRMAVPTAAMSILGMAAAYGVVCGAMMIAGEHEGSTLVFLDIFLGRRGLLWLGKFVVGVVLVLTETMAVSLILRLLNQEPPDWVMGMVGLSRRPPDPNVWFLVLPIVTLEAYAFGLFGSSLTQKVLAGAAIGAVGVTPVWLVGILAPPQVFLVVQLVIAIAVLVISLLTFLGQSREANQGAAPESEGVLDPKGDFLERFEEFEREDHFANEGPVLDDSASVPVVYPVSTNGTGTHAALPANSAKPREPAAAPSPNAVLWWLTIQQAWPLLLTLVGIGLFVGAITAINGQILWPIATLLLGVICGTAAFAPEQRDLSYQFMAAQHLPLKTIWWFKIRFWLIVAMLTTLLMVFAHFLIVAMVLSLGLAPPGAQPAGFQGTLRELMGPMLFFGVWLLYGFCAGQIVVWYCRKNILALLVSLIVGAAAFGLWLPSLLCRGMSGWQMLLPALTMLLATWCLMRVWTSGRIRERKPTTALVGFIATVLVWACLNFGYRAWEMPDVGSPMDTTAFRAQIPFSKDNLAAREVDQALGKIDEPNDAWLAPIAEMARLPVGVLEVPRADGQRPLLIHLPKCQRITAGLLRHAQASEPEPAFEYLAQILSLSRNLRNKAPVESYLVGIETEESALNGLDLLLGRGKPTPKLLRRILDELNRHAAETPPPLDCLLTECLRSGGALANPSVWTLAVPERWLVGSIALSMETPWESERKTRLWQLVWAGLFRAMETPYWQLPEAVEFRTENDSTRAILSAWLPAPDGPGANVTRARLIPLLDESWLADERLFCNVARLRDASTRAQWRVDATRQAIALCLYGIDEQKAAAAVEDLVPKYLPERLPLDPYSGQRFRYRIADEQRLEGIGDILPGQAILWSTGPDRIDHGGRRHGGHLRDDSPLWRRGDFDLITLVPLSR